MIIFYCGFDEEKTMKFAAAFGIRAEFEYRFYDSKDACVKRHPFMLSVDSTNYSLKKIDDCSYISSDDISPYDVLQMFYNVPIDIRLQKKPHNLYHATPLYNLLYILHDRWIKCGIFDRIFTYGEEMKKTCLLYVNGTSALLAINPEKYKVFYAHSNEYGISCDVSIFDVNSIEFYLKEELICKWDKEMISQKIEFFKARYDYTKNDHNITYKHRYNETIDKQEAYDFFNEWIF